MSNRIDQSKKIILIPIFLLLSNCTLMNFKIKTDDNSGSFTKNILSTTNSVKTTPVEYAEDYNANYNPKNLVRPSDFDPQLVQSIQSNLESVQNRAPVKKQTIKTISTVGKESDEIDTDEFEKEFDRTISSESRIKQLKKTNYKKISHKQMTQLKNYADADVENTTEVTGATTPGKYVVRSGDTLMKISFAQYGNVYKWKNILNSNKDKISQYNKLRPGTELVIEGDSYVVVEKNGRPYLIKKNDTLVKISGTVYGDGRKWPLLWKNNKQLIHDPNKIYAGFTLYYLDPEDLKVKKAELKSNEFDRKPTSSK